MIGKFSNSQYKAFTLIELLIVVAIIAILAAIAVPNFLEAQNRAKISRAKADLRTITTGLESYYTDNNSFPYQNARARALSTDGGKITLERLSTPISYLSNESAFSDPFRGQTNMSGANLLVPTQIEDFDDKKNHEYYRYFARNETMESVWNQITSKPKWWALESAGPDRIYDNVTGALNARPTETADGLAFIQKVLYDPTNGSLSYGSIWRVGGQPIGPGTVLYKAVTSQQ